jgi:hypothetical protein
MTAFSAQLAEGLGMPAIAASPNAHPLSLPKQVGCLRKWYFYFRRNTEFLIFTRNSVKFRGIPWNFTAKLCEIFVKLYLHFGPFAQMKKTISFKP